MEIDLTRRLFNEYAKKHKKSDLLQDSYNKIYTDYNGIYYDFLKNISCNILTYENAPKTLNVQLLEWMLRFIGYANIIAVDKDNIWVQGMPDNFTFGNFQFGSLTAPTNTADFDKYTQTMLAGQKVFALNRFNVKLKECKAPFIIPLSNKTNWYYNSDVTDEKLISRTASLLAEIKASIIANIRMQKTPFLGFTKDKNLTSKVVFEQLMEGKPFISIDSSAVDKDGINDLITTFPVQVPNLAQTLSDSWKTTFNEFLSFIGLNNISVDKKERLTAAEGTSNDQQVSMALQIYISARQSQIDILNEALGTNIKVKLNTGAADAINDFYKAELDDLQNVSSLQGGTGGVQSEGNSQETDSKD